MSNSKKLTVECRNYVYEPHTHSHPFGQLILPLKGELHLETSKREFAINEENLFFVPPKYKHTFYSKYKNQFLVLDIPLNMFPNELLNIINQELYEKLDKRWEAIKFLILEEIKNNSNCNQSLINLFHYFSDLLFENIVPESIKYIHKNYNKTITLNELAQIENYSPNYYNNWFKEKMEVNPIDYIQKLRLNRAQYLLKNTDLTILQIAQQIGYEYQSSLNRLFKKYKLNSPSYYRNNY